jgi:hypothetical protein
MFGSLRNLEEDWRRSRNWRDEEGIGFRGRRFQEMDMGQKKTVDGG